MVLPDIDLMEEAEGCYRRGYQHGFQAALDAIEGSTETGTIQRLRRYAGIALQKWRYDLGRQFNRSNGELPKPPPISN